MKNSLLAALGALALPLPLMAADAPKPVTPNDIVAAAPAGDWSAIAASDLMVMELAPDAKQRPRRVVIQLIPPPFSEGWVENIRTLVAARWFDGTAVIRSQDNYVAQWGDAGGDDPKTAKALPGGLRVMSEPDYETTGADAVSKVQEAYRSLWIARNASGMSENLNSPPRNLADMRRTPIGGLDPYGPLSSFWTGWPVATDVDTKVWPVHCYGMVGVGRGLSPNTGDGSSLYVVNGTPPRQLDRNIAVVGRVIEGMEHLSTLPRGTGPLGFYETPEEYTPIVSVRMGSDVAGLPAYEYLSTESASFAAYADKRANRKDDFYTMPAGGVDVCNVPVPVRRAGAAVKTAGK